MISQNTASFNVPNQLETDFHTWPASSLYHKTYNVLFFFFEILIDFKCPLTGRQFAK